MRKVSKDTYESWSRFMAFLLRVVGFGGIIFVPVFWAFTGRIELAFLPFFGGMAGMGEGLNLLREITESRARGKSESNEARNTAQN